MGAVCVHDTKPAVVVVDVAVPIHQTHEGGAEVPELCRFLFPADHLGLVPGQGPFDDRDRLGDARQDAVARFRRHRLGDAARHDPGRVDPLAAEPLDDLLAEAAEGDAVQRELRVLARQADDIANGRIRVEAEQKVR